MVTFGSALAALKDGKRIARTGWNGKGMWLLLVPAESYAAGSWAREVEQGKIHWGDHSLDLLPWIGMKTADNKFVPWLAFSDRHARRRLGISRLKFCPARLTKVTGRCYFLPRKGTVSSLL